ncbi:MAG: DUF1315 domain-containing protein [Gammaproteobacteria bacterium HGW-Gammaproteobacteria-14]|nr:MAG: DUF1315 domain-containing protein [Gammaproteobacteria bacterium HGW-Gammaproteobacteria-14]
MGRDVYDGLRRAVELGRWPDGRALTAEQRQTSLQAIIAWERIHLPEQERTGYIEKPGCASDSHDEQPINWRNGGQQDA